MMTMRNTLLVVTAAGVLTAACMEAHELVVWKHYDAERGTPVRSLDAVQVTVSGYDSSGFSGRYPSALTLSGTWS